MSDTLIGAIPKNSREEVRVSLSEYNGHDIVSARVFFSNGDDDWKPGKQGLTLRVAALPGFLELLAQAETEARRSGLLDREAA